MKYMRLCAFLVLMLAGCMTMDYGRAPPSDWPQLEVKIIKQDFKQVQRTCRNDFWPERQANGCAIADFDARICRIYTWTNNRGVIEHERAHCYGYDHRGESGMRDAWESYKFRNLR